MGPAAFRPQIPTEERNFEHENSDRAELANLPELPEMADTLDVFDDSDVLEASHVFHRASPEALAAMRITRSSSAPAAAISPRMRPSRITRIRSASASTSGRSLDTARHPPPFAAISRTMLWISNLAPTSTPLVGSSRRSTRG